MVCEVEMLTTAGSAPAAMSAKDEIAPWRPGAARSETSAGDAGAGAGVGSLFEGPHGNHSAANVPKPPPTIKERTTIRIHDLVFRLMSSFTSAVAVGTDKGAIRAQPRHDL
jgi:hypothetical protein